MRKNLLNASLVNSHEISVIYLANFSSIDSVDFFLVGNGKKIPLKKEPNAHSSITETRLISEEPIVLGYDYEVRSSEEESVYLEYEDYVGTREFDELYAYDGDDLGPVYTKKGTTFKLWSPLADRVQLKLESGEDKYVLHEMSRKDRGIYEIAFRGDLFLKKYTYIVRVNGREKEILDPYAVGTSVNSKQSVVIDIAALDSVKKVKPKTQFEHYNDAIIYELNIRDFTESLDVENKGTYLGLLNKADYLTKLGITHVQLQPVLDFDNIDDIVKDTYNWGYDPISFFALEGSYSALPEDPLSRLVEFKQLVSELHKRDIRVVVDVVYNHLYNYQTTGFQKNVPYYYFRRYKNIVCNASGCGNDFASERKMARKIIVDSVKYLINTYDIDGLRFDLLGLIDVDTTNEVIKVAKELKPDIILYGEGWHMSTNLPENMKSSILNASQMPGMAFFNDTYRDLIKGGTFDKETKGYISGNLEYKNEVEKVLLGSVLNGKFQDVNQSINYVECHDNQTLYDKLANIYDDQEEILKMVKFANALLLFSLGVPFIHMGQEIGLSKCGLDNTYNVKHVNNMDWKLVEERSDMVQFMADLIKVRKTISSPRISDIEDIKSIFDFFYLPNNALTLTIRDERYLYGHKKILFIINPTEKLLPIEFDEYFKIYFLSTGLIKDKKDILIKNYLATPFSLLIFTLD